MGTASWPHLHKVIFKPQESRKLRAAGHVLFVHIESKKRACGKECHRRKKKRQKRARLERQGVLAAAGTRGGTRGSSQAPARKSRSRVTTRPRSSATCAAGLALPHGPPPPSGEKPAPPQAPPLAHPPAQPLPPPPPPPPAPAQAHPAPPPPPPHLHAPSHTPPLLCSASPPQPPPPPMWKAMPRGMPVRPPGMPKMMWSAGYEAGVKADQRRMAHEQTGPAQRPERAKPQPTQPARVPPWRQGQGWAPMRSTSARSQDAQPQQQTQQQPQQPPQQPRASPAEGRSLSVVSVRSNSIDWGGDESNGYFRST